MNAPVRQAEKHGFFRSFSFFRRRSPVSVLRGIVTPFPLVIEELQRRQAIPGLRECVERYLHNDMPSYCSEKPFLYLARHVITRNFETLRFLHLAEPLEMPTVLGQDSDDLFVASNPLKHALGKLQICKSVHMKEGRIVEEYSHRTIIDFNTSDGKPFKHVRTLWGQPLMEFHNELLRPHAPRQNVRIINDADWITRHGRGNLLAHYREFLALFICHGVLFEDYQPGDPQEMRFIRSILIPAFRHVERYFGLRPLITDLNPTTPETSKFWISYPNDVADTVDAKLSAHRV